MQLVLVLGRVTSKIIHPPRCNVTTWGPKWVQKERRARRNAMTRCPKWVYRGKGPGGPRWSHWRLPTRHEEQGNAPTKDYQSMTLCLSSSSPSSLPLSSSPTSSSLLRYIKYISYTPLQEINYHNPWCQYHKNNVSDSDLDHHVFHCQYFHSRDPHQH